MDKPPSHSAHSDKQRAPKPAQYAPAPAQVQTTTLSPALDTTTNETALATPMLPAEWTHGAQGLFGQGTTANQVQLVTKPGVLTAQRQAAVAEIGKQQGNRQVVQVVAQVQASQAARRQASVQRAAASAETAPATTPEAEQDVLGGSGDGLSMAATGTTPPNEGDVKKQAQRFSPGVLQAKLSVGPAHDAYEQEADRVAAQVVRASVPAAPIAQRVGEEDELQAKPLTPTITPLVQRAARAIDYTKYLPAAVEAVAQPAKPLMQRVEEEELQAKPLVQREAAPEDEAVQAKFVQREATPEEEQVQAKPAIQRASSEEGFETDDHFQAQLGAARGSGTPLPDPTREFMEQHIGADFSGVKVHTDVQSDQLNRSIQAKAFTTGKDVFFREGAYQPGSDGGQELIAHELTHVVQQSGGAMQRAPQQEAQLAPHEAWHVVQQAQGRVKPTDTTEQIPAAKAPTLPTAQHAEAAVLPAKSLVQRRSDAIGGAQARASYKGASASTIQRYSVDEASMLIDAKYKAWKVWYYTVCMPALTTIAAKAGQDFNQYLVGMTAAEFEEKVKALHSEAPDDRGTIRSPSELWAKKTLVESGAYPGMLHKVGTNILVDPKEANNPNLPGFINQYETGVMIWSRGMSISHFAYKQLRESGVLGSEGTADLPTFTMGNLNPTRWLPGLYDVATADGLAHSVSPEDAGIREIMTRTDIPIGVTVQYPVTPPAFVAYLNDGEQVIRGPVTGVTVYRVILMGPGGYSYKLAGGNTNDLPPEAPYRGQVGSQVMIDWEQAAIQWVNTH